MSKPTTRNDYDIYWTTEQRGVTVVEPERKRLVDAKGREVRRKLGFVVPRSEDDDPKRR